MRRFVTSVSEDLVADCRESMLHDSMDLGKLTLHAQTLKENRPKRMVHECKKPRTEDQTSPSSGRVSFAVQNTPKFKRYSGNSTS